MKACPLRSEHREWLLVAVCMLAGFWQPTAPAAPQVECYRLRTPGGAQDINQASDLCYGRLGDRNGLWTVCDRNGGATAGRVYFFSEATLKTARDREPLAADEEFIIVLPHGEWAAFAQANRAAGVDMLADLKRRVEAGTTGADESRLDLEAVAIAPSLKAPHDLHLFVVAEEPWSAVLELSIGPKARQQPTPAEWVAVYAYHEAEDEHGWDHNDGLEGLAYAGQPGQFFWAEEGTRSHTDEKVPRLMFRDPRLGLAKLGAGQVDIMQPMTNRMTQAVRTQREGAMQTLNAITVAGDGSLLAVDRNGGWILRVEPSGKSASRWINLYGPPGLELRKVMADFPEHRGMTYVSIEGIAVDPRGNVWLVDDPAMPEGFRGSAMIRVSGLPELKPAK